MVCRLVSRSSAGWEKTILCSPSRGNSSGLWLCRNCVRPLPERAPRRRVERDRKESVMPFVTTTDNVKLHVEEAGEGTPIVFVHEFAGDQRSWEPQVRYFSRRYRCITFNARGYPPSDVPDDPAKYSQARAADDIRDV